MSNTNLPPFYVGQKVVCLKTSGECKETGARFLEGNTYTVVKCVFCCGVWKVVCKEVAGVYGWWCCVRADLPYCSGAAKYFRPVEESFQQITLQKVIEIESSLISVN